MSRILTEPIPMVDATNNMTTGYPMPMNNVLIGWFELVDYVTLRYQWPTIDVRNTNADDNTDNNAADTALITSPITYSQ